MLESVVHRYQRDFDQLRVAVHYPLQVPHIDTPLAWHHKAKVETLLFQLQQVHQRAFEVQRVRHHISVEARDVECLDDQVLSGAGIGDVADLFPLRVDERGKGIPGIDRHGRVSGGGFKKTKGTPGGASVARRSTAW